MSPQSRSGEPGRHSVGYDGWQSLAGCCGATGCTGGGGRVGGGGGGKVGGGGTGVDVGGGSVGGIWAGGTSCCWPGVGVTTTSWTIVFSVVQAAKAKRTRTAESRRTTPSPGEAGSWSSQPTTSSPGLNRSRRRVGGAANRIAIIHAVNRQAPERRQAEGWCCKSIYSRCRIAIPLLGIMENGHGRR